MQKTVKVNGQVIPQDAIQFELERLVRFYAEHGMSQDQIKAQLPALVQKATEQAIGTKLLMDEAAKLDLPVSDAELDEQVAKIVEQVGGEEAFRQALQQQNTSEDAFREQLRRGRRVDKLIEKAVAGEPDPTEAEIEAYFNGHQDEFAKGERVLAQHILISPDGDTQTSKDEAKAKIGTIRERVLEGKSFADEAAAHSMCPSGKEGGSLGWFSRGMMVKEFDDAAFALPVGGMSDIIETQFGYHLVLKNDMESAASPELSEVEDKVRDFLRHTRRGEALSAFVDELREKATIEIS